MSNMIKFNKDIFIVTTNNVEKPSKNISNHGYGTSDNITTLGYCSYLKCIVPNDIKIEGVDNFSDGYISDIEMNIKLSNIEDRPGPAINDTSITPLIIVIDNTKNSIIEDSNSILESFELGGITYYGYPCDVKQKEGSDSGYQIINKNDNTTIFNIKIKINSNNFTIDNSFIKIKPINILAYNIKDSGGSTTTEKFGKNIEIELISINFNTKIGDSTIKIGGTSTYIEGSTSIGAGEPKGYALELGAAGNTIVSTTNGSWVQISDKRDKTDFQPIENASQFLEKLEPVTYVMNQRYKYIDENGNFNEKEYLNKTKAGHRRQAGLIAQDVYKALLETYGNDNYAQIVDIANYDYPNSDDDTYSMSYTSLVPFLIKAVQEQSKIIDELEEKILKLKNNKETTEE